MPAHAYPTNGLGAGRAGVGPRQCGAARTLARMCGVLCTERSSTYGKLAPVPTTVDPSQSLVRRHTMPVTAETSRRKASARDFRGRALIHSTHSKLPRAMHIVALWNICCLFVTHATFHLLMSALNVGFL